MKWLQIVVRGCVVAVVAVLCVLWFRRLDARALMAALAGASPAWLLLCGAANLPLVWLKARRMRLLLDGKMATPRLMSAYLASYAADNLVMSQAGLGFRVASFRLHGVPISTAVAVQVVDKAIEVLGLAVVAGGALLLPQAPAGLRLIVGSSFAAGTVALVLGLALFPRLRSDLAQKIGDAARPLGRPRVALEVAALSIAAWIVEATMVMTVLYGFGAQAHLLAATGLVLLMVNMAALVPGLPANLGTFEVACVVALTMLAVPRELALSIAIAYHAMHTIPVTVAGLIVQPRALRRARVSDEDARVT
jgi:uncharacterized membrane protein YbhN (UPF0104 family)